MADIDYLKRMIFPGESGGDYNALFGYSNRPGGQFGGMNLTDLTVDQALAFSNPSGPYGQWVKGQVGRVATPMGAYQIVGTTLRGAKEGLGLTGSERMTPELQDQLGMWIYQNQGPGAWEAWGKGGGGGGGGPVTQSTKGGAPMVGLLDMNDEPKPFGDRLKESWRSGELAENLALAFNSLRMRPDANLAQTIGRRQDRREQSETINRTAQWLASNGRPDLAEAMLSGALSGTDAARIAMTPAEAPEPVKGVVVDGRLVNPLTGEVIYEGAGGDPMSTIGKLASDLNAGRITQEQYDVALANMAPPGMVIESDGAGGFRMVQGAGAGAGVKPLTEGQSKDNVYATRAEGALATLDPVAESLTSLGQRAAEMDPTGFVRSAVQTPEFQIAKNAGDEFLQAVLRKDTGAAITAQEQELYGKTYLPQPGDGPEVLQQKQIARRRAVDAIRAGMSPQQIETLTRTLGGGGDGDWTEVDGVKIRVKP
jgi:hypothetical protein